jgi:hypothetical protein
MIVALGMIDIASIARGGSGCRDSMGRLRESLVGLHIVRRLPSTDREIIRRLPELAGAKLGWAKTTTEII